jgi:hypothetical protein
MQPLLMRLTLGSEKQTVDFMSICFERQCFSLASACIDCHCENRSFIVASCRRSFELLFCRFRMDMVISAGKSRKNVDAYVMLPPDAKKALDLLIDCRSRVGIPETNEYIFARFSENSPMSGNNELREVIQSCPELHSPDKITSTSLRKYIATVSQVIGVDGTCSWIR